MITRLLLLACVLSVPEPEPLVSLRHVAEFLGVPVQTLYDWRKKRRRSGQGPTGYKVGHQIRFRMSEVEAWLQQRRETERRAS